MKTIGFFSNRSAVGKTTLVYHIAWMLSEMGVSLIAADFDPQASLTSAFLPEDRLEEIWSDARALTVAGAIEPLIEASSDVLAPVIERCGDNIGLLPGDIRLLDFEDRLAVAWSDPSSEMFKITEVFRRLLRVVAATSGAALALVEVGSGSNAISRAARLACDFIVVPLLADWPSLQGIALAAGQSRYWQLQLGEYRRQQAGSQSADLSMGRMEPVGYVLLRHAARVDRSNDTSDKFLADIPKQYATCVLGQSHFAPTVEDDYNCLAILKDYRSLLPLAHDARKPMFLLKPADGAFGGHQNAVLDCYKAYRGLTENLLRRCRIPV
jgi:chromosome partitioning protein